MSRYLRIDRETLDRLWTVAQERKMAFESPSSVLRALVLGDAKSKPKPSRVQIRVDDEVWDEMKRKAARRGIDAKYEKDTLLRTLIGEGVGITTANPEVLGKRPPAKRG
jgi:hypothetical protein